MLAFGWCRLARCGAAARRAGEGYGMGTDIAPRLTADDQIIGERATTAREFDPAEIGHGRHGETAVPIGIAVLPLIVVVSVNLLMSFIILPRLDFSFLAEARWGATSLSAVACVSSVAVGLPTAILPLIPVIRRRLPPLRARMAAAAPTSVVTALSRAPPLECCSRVLMFA